jgi:phage terminase large subunit-like protein
MNLQFDLLSKLSEGLKEGAEKLIVPDAVKWIEKEFIIPETRHDPKLRGRFILLPHQKDLIREIFSKDENGLYKYSIIVWSDIKKSWKSSIAAAVTLYRCEHAEYGEFYVVANDLKQADSRVAHYIRRAIELNPKLKAKYKINGYRITAPNGSYIEAVPIDPSGEAGGNADSVVFSELWGAAEDAKQKMWSEMTVPPGKHGRAWRWVESYAGYIEESKLLYSLYDLGVKQGRKLWPGRMYPTTDGPDAELEVYVNDTARMLCYWGTVPRVPDQKKTYYSAESSILLPNEFERLHRNQWVSNTSTFIPMEWWYACRRSDEEWPEIDKKHQSVIISMDAAVSNDCFGVVMSCRHPVFTDEVVILYSNKWAPDSRNHKIDYEGTDEYPGPIKVVERLVKEYNVVQICYDPFQLHDCAMRMKKKGLAWMKEFNQQGDRARADSQLRDLIRDRRIWHKGDVDLTAHLQNSNSKIDDQDSKIRLVKRVDHLKIDLAVAMSMGAHELLRLNLA